MGLGLRFGEGEGPVFDRPVRDEHAIAQLPVPDPQTELRYVMDVVATLRGALGARLPLIGFAGSPWTLAPYMVEGRGGSVCERSTGMASAVPEPLTATIGQAPFREAGCLYV